MWLFLFYVYSALLLARIRSRMREFGGVEKAGKLCDGDFSAPQIGGNYEKRGS
jgi:hypothetical protein